jgi:hypothetical protein
MLRGAAYVKAPMETFVLTHPLRALRWGATYLAVKTLLDMRRRRTAHDQVARWPAR